MEKDRVTYLEDKKSKHLKKNKIIEMLKTERNNLKDQLNSYEQGPYARKTTEVYMLYFPLQSFIPLVKNKCRYGLFRTKKN